MKGRRGRRGKQLLDGLTEKRGYYNWKEEAPDRTVQTARFRRGYGTVVMQTALGIPENKKMIQQIISVLEQ